MRMRTLFLNEIPNTYQIERTFEADCRSLWTGSSTEGSSGIWKSENPADSLYIQTYSTGSAIFIETVDGNSFNVFLDGDITDGIACQEFFRKIGDVFGYVQRFGSGSGELNGERRGRTDQHVQTFRG